MRASAGDLSYVNTRYAVLRYQALKAALIRDSSRWAENLGDDGRRASNHASEVNSRFGVPEPLEGSGGSRLEAEHVARLSYISGTRGWIDRERNRGGARGHADSLVGACGGVERLQQSSLPSLFVPDRRAVEPESVNPRWCEADVEKPAAETNEGVQLVSTRVAGVEGEKMQWRSTASVLLAANDQNRMAVSEGFDGGFERGQFGDFAFTGCCSL
jgi:transposase InsO family protein